MDTKKNVLTLDDKLDFETRLVDSDHQSLRLWLRLLSTATIIENKVKGSLRDEFGISLPRFDLMAQLQKNPEGLRMGELSQRIMVTSGSITSLTDQLEKEGLVVRVPEPGDRRAYLVQLTPTGHKAFAPIAKAHEKWITELFDSVEGKTIKQLYKNLKNLKEAVLSCEHGTHP